jgi:hypothetical protein
MIRINFPHANDEKASFVVKPVRADIGTVTTAMVFRRCNPGGRSNEPD